MSRVLDQIMSRDGRYIVQAQDLFTDADRPCAALRRYAEKVGHESRVGGWLYAAIMLRTSAMRQDEDIRLAAVANRVRRLRKAAAMRRAWSEAKAKHNPMSMDIQRWEREAAEYERAAKAVEEMPV